MPPKQSAAAITASSSAVGAASGGTGGPPNLPSQQQQQQQPPPQVRLPRAQQPDPADAIAVRRFYTRCAKRLIVELTLVCKKRPGDGKYTRCTW